MSRDTSQKLDPIHSRQDLFSYFQDGSTDPGKRGIGLEHEKFGFFAPPGTLPTPLPYKDGVEILMKQLSERFGWIPNEDNGHITALERDDAAITLEPGGQFELSGGVCSTLSGNEAELKRHFEEVESISAEHNIHWLLMGAQPLHSLDEISWMPKSRYSLMSGYLPTKGALALEMMKMTCTVQANFDYTDEEDAADMLRAILSVTPIVSALFASSPFRHGAPADDLVRRCRIWTQTDPDRTGYVPKMLAPGYTFNDYIEYLIDIPMICILRDGKYIPAKGVSFKRFYEEGVEGHFATIADWEMHLSMVWPEVRMKSYIEVRGADVVPLPLMLSMAALWKGILYDKEARKRATDLTAGLNIQARQALHEDMIVHALGARLGNESMLDLGRTLVSIASDGLQRLNVEGAKDDRDFLIPLQEQILAPGQSLATQLLKSFYDNPERGVLGAIEPLFTQPL